MLFDNPVIRPESYGTHPFAGLKKHVYIDICDVELSGHLGFNSIMSYVDVTKQPTLHHKIKYLFELWDTWLSGNR